MAAVLLSPVAAIGYGMAFWRFAADMRWSGDFVIDNGLFSRWQVWFAVAAVTHVAAWQVDRRDSAARAEPEAQEDHRPSV